MEAKNHVPLLDIASSETGCCALIKPEEWDDRTITFENKLFVRVRSRSLFHIPLNLGKVMTVAQKKIHDAAAEAEEYLTLSDEVSSLHADHYYAVSKLVPGMDNVKISGTYRTMVFEGPFKDSPKWHQQLRAFIGSKGERLLHSYYFYTTCPNCAKVYGKNYVVGFAKTG